MLNGFVAPKTKWLVVVTGHPWILFFTERTLNTLSIKSKLRNQQGLTCCQLAIASELSDNQSRRRGGPLGDASSPRSFSGSSSCKSEDQDESGLVDALAVAISHVRISKPKRSRLCEPTCPVQQQCSSNMKANNLCKAF